jgi:hypothetical protein
VTCEVRRILASGQVTGACRFSAVDRGASSWWVVRARKAEGSGSTKGDRFRAVDFGARLEGVLRVLRDRGGPPSARTLVFRGPRGGELSRSDVSRDLHKHALEDAALRRSLRLHDLRHTAAASWLAAGLPLIYVQRQLGHASVTTTRQVYGHLEESFLRGAAERVERLNWTPADPLDGADTAGALPRLLPRTPSLPAEALCKNKSPAICGAFSCAEEDSNLHGPYSPQGPQPCASTNSATGAGGLATGVAGRRSIAPRLIPSGPPATFTEHMFVPLSEDRPGARSWT